MLDDEDTEGLFTVLRSIMALWARVPPAALKALFNSLEPTSNSSLEPTSRTGGQAGACSAKTTAHAERGREGSGALSSQQDGS